MYVLNVQWNHIHIMYQHFIVLYPDWCIRQDHIHNGHIPHDWQSIDIT